MRGDGGQLLLGVEDDGAADGARPRHGDHTDRARLAALVANKTTPSVSVDVEVLATPSGPVVVVLQTLQVVHEVRAERRITSARTAEVLQLSTDKARAILNDLVERGYLEARGEGKGRTYHLTAGMYRKMGGPAGDVRTRASTTSNTNRWCSPTSPSTGRPHAPK